MLWRAFSADNVYFIHFYHGLYLEFDVLCCKQTINQLILELWSVALWPNSYLTLLDPGSILRPSFNFIKSAPHCIRSSCSSITSMCTTSFDIGMPALGLSSTQMTDCRCLIHWKIISWFFLVPAGVSAVHGDFQFLDDALENSIFSWAMPPLMLIPWKFFQYFRNHFWLF